MLIVKAFFSLAFAPMEGQKAVFLALLASKLQKLRGLGCRGLVKQHLYIKRGALRLFSIGIVRAVRVMSSLIAAFLWPSLLVEGQKAVFLALLASKLQKLVRHFCGFCFFSIGIVRAVRVLFCRSSCKCRSFALFLC